MTNITNLVDWKKVSRKEKLDEEFIYEYEKFIDFKELSSNKKVKFTLELVKRYKDEWDWCELTERNLSDEIIDEMFDYVDKYSYISCSKKINENIVRKHFDQFEKEDLADLLIHQKLTDHFLEDFFDRLPKEEIFEYQKLSKSFLKKHVDKINLNDIYLNSHNREILKSSI
jgi:hypothetical protein